MLRERTDPAFARAFKRIAQLALLGIALAGLTSCGGGGSSTPKTATPAETPTPTPPEIRITPTPTDLPPPTEAELAAATIITPGETITGTLESADDVKYYRLEVVEDSSFEFTLDAEAGFEVAILDGIGNVLTTAKTASEAKASISAKKGHVYTRVTRDTSLGRGFNSYELKAKLLDDVGSLLPVRFKKGLPRITIPLPNGSVTIDLTPLAHTPPLGEPDVIAKFSLSMGNFKVEGQTLKPTISYAGAPVSREIFRGTATLCVQDACAQELAEILVQTIGVTVKEDYRPETGELLRGYDEVRTSGTPVSASLAWGSRPLNEYFDYPTDAVVSFALEGADPIGSQRSIRTDPAGKSRVVVNFDPSLLLTAPKRLEVRLSAMIPNRPKAHFTIYLHIEKPTQPAGGTPPAEQPGGQQPGETPAMLPEGVVPTDEALCRTIAIGYREGDPETGAPPAEFCRTGMRALGLVGQVLPGGTPYINCCNLL